jgi:hypothetical protein
MRFIRNIGILPQSVQDDPSQLLLGRVRVAHVIGAGAGLSVATPVTTVKELPPNYTVVPVMEQDATCWITAKTAAGFTLNIAPRLAATTLAAGTVDVFIFG